MNTTLLFFVLLVPVSGFIAWAGDKIGHIIGKRRHSVLGLRPRHTATLITILSGIGIAALSFGLMFLSSASFREVVQRGGQLRRENEDLGQQIKVSGLRVRRLQQEATDAEVRHQQAEQARNEALRHREEAEKRYQSATKELLKAEAELSREKRRLGRTQASLERAEKQVAIAQRARVEAQQRRERAEKAARLVEQRLTVAQGAALTAQNQAKRATQDFYVVVREQKRRLEGQRTELAQLNEQVALQTGLLTASQNKVAEQEGRAQGQRREVARLADELRFLERQRSSLAEERKELEWRRDQAQKSLNEVMRATVALRNGQISFRVGEEVARLSISGGNEFRVHNALESLMATAAQSAERRGARTAPGAIRAVWIPDHWIEEQSATRPAGDTISEFEMLHQIAKNISKSAEEVVVVVSALGNAVVGEPVPVELRTWRNPLIFSAGQSVGEVIVEGNRPGAHIADALYTFLRGDVRKRLLEAGTIPVGSGDEQVVGETSMETLMKAVDAVRALRVRTRVIVRAARNLHAADPALLEFEVKPVDTPLITSAGERDGLVVGR